MVMKYLEGHYLYVAPVSCKFHKTFVNVIGNRRTAKQNMLQSPGLALWTVKNSTVTNGRICNTAAKYGDLEMLQYLQQNGCICDAMTWAYAAEGGHQNILEWAFNNNFFGFPWDEMACVYAAHGDQLDVLLYLRDHGCPWNERLIYYSAAIAGSYSKVWQWLRGDNPPRESRFQNLAPSTAFEFNLSVSLERFWLLQESVRDGFHIDQANMNRDIFWSYLMWKHHRAQSHTADDDDDDDSTGLPDLEEDNNDEDSTGLPDLEEA